MGQVVVGNDVVDLSDPRCAGKSLSERFLSRVFAVEEGELIHGSRQPDRMLWLLWAAKEAAFKVVSKARRSPPPFVHRAFAVSVGDLGDVGAPPTLWSGQGSGIVRYDGWTIPFLAESTSDWIHAVAWWMPSTPAGAAPGGSESPPPGLRWGLTPVLDVFLGEATQDLTALRAGHFSERERPAVHSLASAAARIVARRAVAGSLGIAQDRLELICEGGPTGRTPPRLLQDGAPSATDVSLSHHGGLVAWAAALSTAKAGS